MAHSRILIVLVMAMTLTLLAVPMRTIPAQEPAPHDQRWRDGMG